MTADIATDALTMAWFRRKPVAGLIHHSDRGSQYASHIFQAKLKKYGMLCSMPQREAIHYAASRMWNCHSRKGNCWDNDDENGVEYIEVFYNRKQLHSTLRYKPPMQFLSDWFTAGQEEKPGEGRSKVSECYR